MRHRRKARPSLKERFLVYVMPFLLFKIFMVQYRSKLTEEDISCSDPTCVSEFAQKAFSREDPIFLMMVNHASRQFFLNFVCHFKQTKTKARLLVISESIDIISISNSNKISSILYANPFSDEVHYGFKRYREFIMLRSLMVLSILNVERSVCVTDVDSVWISDPLPYMLYQYADISAQMDGVNICGGFLYLSASNRKVVSLWNETVLEYAQVVEKDDGSIESTEQGILNKLLATKYKTLTVIKLSSNLFPSGEDYFGHRSTTVPVIVHNNYIVGTDMKIKRFQASNLWNISCSMDPM